MYFVYVIRSEKDGRFYVGLCKDIDKEYGNIISEKHFQQRDTGHGNYFLLRVMKPWIWQEKGKNI